MAQDDLTRFRILLLMADEAAYQGLRKGLGDSFEFFRVRNGLEALEVVDWVEPDLIVADIDIPNLSATDAVRAIRKDARYSDTPVLFLLSNRDASVSRTFSFERAAELFLERPIAIPLVRRKLAELCESYGVQARKKKHTIAEVTRLFERAVLEARDEESGAGTQTGFQTLSEQLQAASASPRVRILVVDDDQETRALVRTALGRDYEIVVTENPELAPDKIIAYEPDILLANSRLSRLSGPHLATLVRVNKRLQGARFVMMLDQGEILEGPLAKATPDLENLRKPITVDKLRLKIMEIIRRPGFSRARKRVPYEEVLRREGEIAR